MRWEIMGRLDGYKPMLQGLYLHGMLHLMLRAQTSVTETTKSPSFPSTSPLAVLDKTQINLAVDKDDGCEWRFFTPPMLSYFLLCNKTYIVSVSCHIILLHQTFLLFHLFIVIIIIIIIIISSGSTVVVILIITKITNTHTTVQNKKLHQLNLRVRVRVRWVMSFHDYEPINSAKPWKFRV